jgi:hypothetical protein
MIGQFRQVFLVLFFIINFTSFSQDKIVDPLETKLEEFFKSRRLRITAKEIQREKYIIELMQHISKEIGIRHPSYSYSGNAYYDNLERQLLDIDNLISRLSQSGGDDIVGFARELREKILKAVKSPEIDNKKEAFFKRSVQLLMLAEKAVASGNANQLQNNNSEFQEIFKKQIEEKRTLNSQESKVTIFDIFYQWDSASLTKYLVTDGKLKYYQGKLKKTGTSAERSRMAKDLFERSLFAFNNGEYLLSSDLLENLLNTYDYVTSKDKINYYLGLSYFYSNQYDFSAISLEKIMNAPVFDHFTAVSLLKIYIADKNVPAIKTLADRFPSISSEDNFMGDFYFEAGKFLFNENEFAKAGTLLASVPQKHPLYYDARYYYALSKFKTDVNEAKQLLNQLINVAELHPQLRGDCLLKLGYLSYESINYVDAIFWFNEIPESYDNYDAALISNAWCYYEIENLKKEDEIKNYNSAKHYVNRVLLGYKNSEHINEAKALLGYIKQKEDNIIGAEKEFKHIFESMTYKTLSDEFLRERDSLKHVKSNVEKLMITALEKKDRSSFKRLDDITYNIDKKLYKLKYMDFSSVSPTVNSDINVIQRQISEFERFREKAFVREDLELVERIDNNLLRLYTVLNKYKGNKKTSLFGFNYFQEQPLARKVSLLENMFKNYQGIVKNSQKEKEYIKVKISNLQEERETAKSKNDFNHLAKIDMLIYRLNDNLQKIDFIETYSKNQREIKTAANLDYWSNYGAYQLTNIQYMQQKKIDSENSNSRKILSKIDNILDDRNLILQEKIKSVEGTIMIMNRRVSKQRRIAEREQKKKFFETEFFDESTSEVNEDSLRLVMEQRALNMMKNIPLKANTDSLIDSLKVDSNNINVNSAKPEDESDNDDPEKKSKSAVNKEAINEE